MSYYSKVSYTADGATVNFVVPFSFIDRLHVKVYLDDVETTAFTWSSDTLIVLDTAPVSGVIVRIQRYSKIDTRLVDYADDAYLTENDLDQDSIQDKYLIQENKDSITTAEESATDLDVRVTQNETDITTNSADIVTNASDISTNASNISSNDTDIATNAGNISTNASNISSNDSGISALDARITQNETDISTNASNIVSGDAATLASAKEYADAVNTTSNIERWETATLYLVDSDVFNDGKLYKCLVEHTSGIFATDLSSNYWEEMSRSLTSTEVKTYYESNADTNAFTDSEKVLLAEVGTAKTDSHELNGFNRDAPDSMGIVELCTDGTLIHRIDQNGNYTTNLSTHVNYDPAIVDGEFYDGTTATANTISVSPVTGNSLEFYADGTKFTKSTSAQILLDSTSDIQYIYFDETGTLQYTTTFNSYLITKYAFTTYVIYNSASADLIGFGDERHGLQMDGQTHLYLHNNLGARYYSGMSADELDEGSTIHGTISGGIMYDEDIKHTLESQDLLPFLYINGTDWELTDPDDKLGYINAGDSYISYNENTAGSYQLTEMTDAHDRTIMFLLATNNAMYPYVKIIGQNKYLGNTGARNAISTELHNMTITGLPTKEFIFVGAAILNRKGNISKLSDGSLYLDLRSVQTIGSGASSTQIIDHSLTINRNISGQHTASSVTYNSNSNDLSASTCQDAIDEMMDERLLSTAPSEISTLTEKTNLVNDDIVLIEDSENSFSKKKAKLQNLIGGSGSSTYISDGDAEQGTTGWTLYKNSSATGEPDDFGGTPSELSFATTSTEPLSGTKSFLLSGSTISNLEGVYYEFDIENKHKAAMLLLDMYSSSTVDTGDFKFFLVGSTDNFVADFQSITSVSGGSLSESIRTIASLQTSYDATKYRFCIHSQVSTATAHNLKFEIGELWDQPSVSGAASSDWESFTPSLTNFTISSNTMKWRRDGGDLLLNGYMVISGVTGVMSMLLPNSLNYLPNIGNVGNVSKQATGTSAVDNGSIQPILNNSIQFMGDDGLSAWTSGVPSAWNAGDLLLFNNARIPIQGWSSNVKMSTDYGARNVRSYLNTGDSTQTLLANTFNTYTFDSQVDLNGGTFTSSSVVTINEEGFYDISYNIPYTTGSTLPDNIQSFLSLDNSTAVANRYGVDIRNPQVSNDTYTLAGSFNGLYLTKGQTLSVSVYPTGQSCTVPAGFGKIGSFVVNKLPAPQTILESEKVLVEANTDSGQLVVKGSPAWTTIIFDDAPVNSHGMYNTTTGIFTSGLNKSYSVSAKVTMRYLDVVLADTLFLELLKNGSPVQRDSLEFDATNGAHTQSLNVSLSSINLAVGDTLSVRVGNNTSSDGQIETTSYMNTFTLSSN